VRRSQGAAPLVAPSLLSADFSILGEEIRALAAAGADWLHVDVMDGHFVPNLTLGPVVLKDLKKISALPLDVHLMIEKPERYIAEFIKAGSDVLTIHVEATGDPRQVLSEIRNLGAKAGISLRPRTPLSQILPLLEFADLVLVMTVEPGFGGQTFMLDQVPKIRSLRTEIEKQNHPILLEVDGGVNAETRVHCAEADVLVAGSYVFQQDYAQAIRLLKGLA
jgi:ribulose-phosphate 3-epimerase